ncbi:MAG: archease [Candidatus Kapaibacteriota bacterium]
MFKEIQHTADVGIYVESTSFRNFFYDAAMGLMAISEIEPESNNDRLSIEIFKDKAEEKEILLIDWLNFLIYKLDNKYYLSNCHIQFKKNFLIAKCYFNKLKMRKLLIKSATFHNLQLIKYKLLIKANIIFDI